MEIYIGADHNGFEMKQEISQWLTEQGHTVHDLGADSFDKTDDYPDFGVKVAKAVSESGGRGILLCGSGVGMAVAAGKVPGIRAAVIHDPLIAIAARQDDDVNVLSLGASYIDTNRAKEVITSWLTTPFSEEERHKRRIQKITDLEKHGE